MKLRAIRVKKIPSLIALAKNQIFLNRHIESMRYINPMNTQYITDTSGKRVSVIIPITDYENLIEDVADLASVAERRDDERISLDEVKANLVKDGLLQG